MTPPPTNRNQLVLLVDDDTSLLEMAKAIFTFRGHRVLLASNFNEAADAIHEHAEPMWAFVDLNLKHTAGDNSGCTILQYAKDVAHHRIAAHAWTGEGNKAQWAEALKAGAIDVKPKVNEDPEYLAVYVEESDLLRIVCEVSTDSLTGLYNYREFRRNVLRDMKVSRDRGHVEVSSMIAIDVDRFKLVNDAHGHRTGDEALKLIARVLRMRARPSDHLCRRSGDEFLLSAHGATRHEAESIGRECQADLDRRLRERPLLAADGSAISVGFTFGVAQIRRKELELTKNDEELEAKLDQLIEEADIGEERGLMAAKRNRQRELSASDSASHVWASTSPDRSRARRAQAPRGAGQSQRCD